MGRRIWRGVSGRIIGEATVETRDDMRDRVGEVGGA